VHFQPLGRDVDFREGKRNRFVTLQQEIALWKPVWLEQPAVELVKSAVKGVGIEHWIAISPNRDDTSAAQNPFRFRKKRRCIEPMERLRRGDEICRRSGNAARFRGRESVLDALMRSSVCQLRLTWVGCDYALEVARQSGRCLAATGTSIDRERMPRCEVRQRLEQRIGIMWPIRAV
jgi:hypothetical protein